MCLSRFVWDGLGDCEFSQLALYSDPTDIATPGSLLETVVFLKVSSILGIFV